MKLTMKWEIQQCLHLVMGLILLALCACNSGSGSSTAGSDGGSTSSGNSGAHFDVMCMSDRINNPSAPFHYSYKYSDASGSTDKEADITPQAMDITITDASGSHNYHGVRSNEESWNSAVLDLSNLRITGLSARLDSLNGGSALAQRGSESVNGYSATKYAIDTTSANSSDKQQFETLFGKGSFEKGTAWAPEDGCAVKLILDEAIVQNDGSVNKGHYELNMIRK